MRDLFVFRPWTTGYCSLLQTSAFTVQRPITLSWSLCWNHSVLLIIFIAICTSDFFLYCAFISLLYQTCCQHSRWRYTVDFKRSKLMIPVSFLGFPLPKVLCFFQQWVSVCGDLACYFHVTPGLWRSAQSVSWWFPPPAILQSSVPRNKSSLILSFNTSLLCLFRCFFSFFSSGMTLNHQ